MFVCSASDYIVPVLRYNIIYVFCREVLGWSVYQHIVQCSRLSIQPVLLGPSWPLTPETYQAYGMHSLHVDLVGVEEHCIILFMSAHYGKR